MANAERGVYTWKVNGVFHHCLGSLNPDDGIAKSLQLYIFDSQNELENRHRWGDHLSRELTQTLQDILHQNNPFIIQFKHLTLENNLTTKAISLNDQSINVDQRVYNKPSADQVAGIWIEGLFFCKN